MASPPRTPQQLREHYDIEVELADRLRNANATERAQLYGQVYDELYLRVPNHPQLTLSQNPDSITKMNAGKMRLLKPLLRPDLTFLEVGAGDAKLSLAVCPHVHQVYGLDVAQEITGRVRGPANFKFVHSTGCDVPLPDESVDLAYSDQVMEHIHPDDAVAQLREIYRVLRPGGIYLCITPNRLSGPHDISRLFNDELARGFHLREYSMGDLADIFYQAKFSRVWVEKNKGGHRIRISIGLMRFLESVIEGLPQPLRRNLTRSRLLEGALNVTVAGQK